MDTNPLILLLSIALLAAPSRAQERTAPDVAPADGVKAPAELVPAVEHPLRNERPELSGTTPLDAKSARPLPKSAAPERVHVEYDDQGELGTWASGSTYKAGFARDGTTYVPFLGSDAPRSFPVTFRLAHLSVDGTSVAFAADVPPAREGDVVRYDRGGVTEVYALALDSIEQSFVIDALPGALPDVLPGAAAAGEIVLRVSVETELVGRELAERIEFENELGAVRYGRAIAIDAAGASVDAPTRLSADGIEIRVPADFVASARFPLVIDPVVSTFAIDTTSRDSFFPDVACSPGVTDFYLSVYEEIFSASDRDIRYRLLDEDGGSFSTGYIEATLSQYWTNPSVAITGDPTGHRFLVVAEVGFAPSRTIQGRLMTRNGTIQGSPFLISSSDQIGDKLNPDVGGDPYTGGGAFFCVAWERVYGPNDRDIHYRLVSPLGGLQGTSTRLLDNTGASIDTRPSVSKSNDAGNWNVAWQRASSTLPVQQDIRAARVLWNGSITNASFAVDTGVTDTSLPSASSRLDDSERWVIAYQRDFGSDTDVALYALSGSTVIDSVNLTGLEVSAGNLSTLLENQVGPAVDSDGDSFAIAYAESYEGSSVDYDVYVATVALTGNRLNLSEGHKNLAFSTTGEDHVSIASFFGGSQPNVPVRRYLVAWDDLVNPAVHANVEGGFYDAPNFTNFCFPGQGVVGGCPCGNPPTASGRGCANSAGSGALLSAVGTPSINVSTMTLTASGLPATALSIFNQGNAVIDSGVVFGQGIRCVGGSLKRLYVKSASGGVATAPTFLDSSIWVRSLGLGDPISVGSTRSYYVYYRDAVVSGGCPSGSTFNTTPAVQALWVY